MLTDYSGRSPMIAETYPIHFSRVWPVKQLYLETTLLIDGIEDINNVQSLILSHIGEEELTVGELTYRGYYQGSNVSYNVKKMVENGYLSQERSAHDRRTVRVRASEKGLKICGLISSLYDRHVEQLGEGSISQEAMATVNDSLRRLERFWAHDLAYGPKPQADTVPSAAPSAA
jgi:DNA-binding MarR family transcriptional regulator